ncbi:MAG: hypothetical protein ACRC6X_05810 [Culicoidibacterales bacterium]
MEHNDFAEIVTTIRKIKQDDLFKLYSELLKAVEDDLEKVDLVQKYKEAQENYTINRKSNLAVEELRAAKARLDDQVELKELFKVIRRVEFFIDDLNYSINKQIISKKGSCKS